MIDSFDRVFDYSDFETKLRHYFSDSSPIYVDIELRLNEIRITSRGKLTVQVSIDGKIGVKENIGRIIKCCEQSLYPKMIEISEQLQPLTDYQKKDMLLQGLSLVQIQAWNG